MSTPVIGTAFSRVGLLGNPSDVYQGKAIGFPLRAFRARVRIEPSDRFALVPGPAEDVAFDDVRGAWARLAELGCDDGIRLMRAALARFGRRFPELRTLPDHDPRLRFRVSWESDVPRQVGLAGSSAIVVAALRALAGWFGVPLAPFELSEIALAAELEELGITAGPMDRAIQAYDEALVMDFAEPRTPASYRRLDPAWLPPLYVAWDPRPGEPSGRVHGDVRARWLRGDPDVRRAIAIFPGLVDEGLRCLEAGDSAGFRACVDRNFDTRASIWRLSERDLEMVSIGRRLGAAVKLCGSGGAVVGVPRSAADWPAIAEAHARAGYSVVRPRLDGEDPPP